MGGPEIGVKLGREVSGWIDERFAFWGRDSVTKHAALLDYVMPCWLTCRAGGEVEEPPASVRASLTDLCLANRVGIMPLIAGAPEQVRTVIRDTAKRQAHIRQLLRFAQEYNWLGVDVDYEFLPENERDAFSRFMAELGAAFHRRNKLVSVDLHPKVRPDDPWSSGARA